MDMIELKNQQQKNNVYTKPVSNLHSFYIYDIESAEEYTEWFEVIRHASPNDIIKLHINSYGGDLFTALQFMRVLRETEAMVISSVEGACMSAATMLFLCAESYEVSPHSMFMFHNYSGGTFGKGGEMIDQLQHERAWSEKLLKEVYADFLTDKEIDSMLDNKDLWMDGDQIVDRLEKKAKKVKRNYGKAS